MITFFLVFVDIIHIRVEICRLRFYIWRKGRDAWPLPTLCNGVLYCDTDIARDNLTQLLAGTSMSRPWYNSLMCRYMTCHTEGLRLSPINASLNRSNTLFNIIYTFDCHDSTLARMFCKCNQYNALFKRHSKFFFDFASRTKRVLLPRSQLLLQWTCSRPSQQESRLARRTQHLPRILHGPRLNGNARRKQSNLQAHSAKWVLRSCEILMASSKYHVKATRNWEPSHFTSVVR